ncbi:MAG: hypothetical protein A2901_06560 [Elusimicrobia bacterium RIFCSPLOWO2_01_FULL_54_10]|nr:MAG: hypothetical protein A2901_06560 [Elusimicrobia bacterium RIFCSPLOWO2_01_FULL_54_10]
MPGQIDDIKARLDIVELVQSYIRLNKAGSNYKALCPFHSEKTPSFNVSPTRQIWHCFGCGLGGDHFKFVMQIEGLEFPEALELLAKRAGVTLRREDPRLKSERARLYQLAEEAAKLFASVLHGSKSPERITAPLAYLKKRGLADDAITAWRIGYAPDSWEYAMRALAAKGYTPEEIERAGLAVKSGDGRRHDRFRNRITFPISDASGRVVGFSGRIFDQIDKADQSASGLSETADKNSFIKHSDSSTLPVLSAPAKYINTPQTLIYDKSKILYGFDRAKEAIRKENAVVLVEGQMDVVMSHQAGIKNTVAVSGTALSTDQLRTLKRLSNTIISSFDRDAAGEIATKRSLDLAAALDVERKVAILPSGFKDAADAVLKDPEIWRRAVAEAKPVAQFFLETALANHDAKTAAGKRAVAEAVLPEIKIIGSEVEKSHWIQELSRAIGVGEEALWRELAKSKPAAANAFVPAETKKGSAPASRRSQLESLLVGTLLIHPETGQNLPEVPRHAFLDEKRLQIFEIIESALRENVREHSALLAAVPAELQELANYLAFQAEVLHERIESAAERGREILVCIRELEREWARDRLRVLSADIGEAERTKDEARLKVLLDEFSAVSAKVGE